MLEPFQNFILGELFAPAGSRWSAAAEGPGKTTLLAALAVFHDPCLGAMRLRDKDNDATGTEQVETFGDGSSEASAQLATSWVFPVEEGQQNFAPTRTRKGRRAASGRTTDVDGPLRPLRPERRRRCQRSEQADRSGGAKPLKDTHPQPSSARRSATTWAAGQGRVRALLQELWPRHVARGGGRRGSASEPSSKDLIGHQWALDPILQVRQANPPRHSTAGNPVLSRGFVLRARQDSNLRLLPPEGSALSTELRALGRRV